MHVILTSLGCGVGKSKNSVEAEMPVTGTGCPFKVQQSGIVIQRGLRDLEPAIKFFWACARKSCPEVTGLKGNRRFKLLDVVWKLAWHCWNLYLCLSLLGIPKTLGARRC